MKFLNRLWSAVPPLVLLFLTLYALFGQSVVGIKDGSLFVKGPLADVPPRQNQPAKLLDGPSPLQEQPISPAPTTSKNNVDESDHMEIKDAVFTKEAAPQPQCTGNKGGLMELNRPLKVFVYGPIEEMLIHARNPSKWQCDEGMFGVQVRIPRYFSTVYEHRVSHPKDADLILMAAYCRCWNIELIKAMNTTRNQWHHRTYTWILGNFSQEYPGVLHRRGMRDVVFVFPGGDGAETVPGWTEMFPNAIFLNTDASNFMQKLPDWPFHRREKDIVIPGYYGSLDALSSTTSVKAKKTLAIYCGSLDKSKQRTALGQLSKNYTKSTRVIIKKWCPYAKLVNSSKFCIVPQGWTPWTVRAYEAMIQGCLPVLFGEKFELPYQQHMAYKDFVIRWPEDKIDSRLIEYLESIPDERLETMQKAVLRDRYKITWDWTVQPNSFETVLPYLEDKFCTHSLGQS